MTLLSRMKKLIDEHALSVRKFEFHVVESEDEENTVLENINLDDGSLITIFRIYDDNEESVASV